MPSPALLLSLAGAAEKSIQGGGRETEPQDGIVYFKPHKS